VQIRLVSGNAKGSSQAVRNGAGAEMLAAFGFSESEGKMQLSAIGSSVRRKNLLRMDDVRENAFPDAGLRSGLLFSRRLKYCQHGRKEEGK